MWYSTPPLQPSACGTLAEVYRWEFLLLIQRDRKKLSKKLGLPHPTPQTPLGTNAIAWHPPLLQDPHTKT